MDLIALLAIVMCSMGLAFATTKAALSMLFFIMNRHIPGTEAVAVTPSSEFTYEKQTIRYATPAA